MVVFVTTFSSMRRPRRAGASDLAARRHPRVLGRIALLVSGCIGAIPLPHSTNSFTAFSLICAIAILFTTREVLGQSLGAAILAMLAATAYSLSGYAHGLPFGAGDATIFVGIALYVIGMASLSRLHLQGAIDLLAGVSFGFLIRALIFPSTLGPDTDINLWKYAIGVAVPILVLYVLAEMRVSYFINIIALVVLAIVSFVLDTRSEALACIAAVITLLIMNGRAVQRSRAANFSRGVILVISGLALAYIMPLLMKSGIFGASVQEKTTLQTSSGASLLFAGRTETPLSIAAIWAHPFTGWGSTNLIDVDTFTLGQRIAGFLNLSPSAYLPNWIRADGSVTLHSLLFTSWAEAGISAAFFFFWVIYLVLRFGPTVRGKWSAVSVIAIYQLLWAVLFSPWSSGQVLTVAGTVVVALAARAESRTRSLAQAEGLIPRSRR